MTTKSNACQMEQVAPFLDGSLSPTAKKSFETHLERCERCRQSLDQSVASENEWCEVRNSLTTDGLAATATGDRIGTGTRLADLSFYRRMLAPSDDPQMLGRIGNYEIVGLLGHGGMGVVFKGFDASLNRYVAIKMMALQFAANGAARQRFSREAQAAGAVVHEHVIAIHCVSQWQETPYLVMPYIRGISLQKRIDEAGALQLRELLRIGMQVAAGLAAAHAQGLIHRDVKPANILMEEGVDRVVLTDFGLARAIDDVRLTRTDTVVGTPQYMSPEQVNDEPLDFRTDLFSLGSVLYEASTGRPAFQAVTSYGVLRKIKEQQPPPIRQFNPDLPDWFVMFISRLMEKEPEERFESAAEVATLLKRCLSHVEQPHLSELPDSLALPRSINLRSFTWRVIMATVLFSLIFGTAAWMMSSAPDGLSEADAPQQSVVDEPAQDETTAASATKYTSAKEAFQVGAAFYNAKNYKASREPFEAAIRLAKDDQAMKLKAYTALIPSYRQIPEFEPFQTAAEYVITNDPRDASRSLVGRAFLSFAFNRGQIPNLVKRYEKQLAREPDNWMAVYLLSEIYSKGTSLPADINQPKRAIALIQQLAKLDAKRKGKVGDQAAKMSPAEALKISREKAKLARQYMKARKYQEAAKLYEEIAPLDPTSHAWHLKEAASAWLKIDNQENALRLALAAEKAPAEARNDQLTHFFERNLGNIFLKLGKPKMAIPHYEIAVEKTNNEGYVKGTKASLEEAIAKSKE